MRRTVASVALTLGGAVALLAVRYPENPGPSRLGESLPQAKSECQIFWAADVDSTPAHIGEGYETPDRKMKLFRHKHPDDIDLAKGGFVGGIENTHATQTSNTYKELKKKDMGCIWFRAYTSASGDLEYDAYFYHFKGGKPTQLMNVIWCQHGRGANPDRKPIWTSFPEGNMCETFLMSWGKVTVEIKADPGKMLTTQELLPILRKKLAEKGLTPAQVSAAARYAAGSGPWYPCSPNGCCRAT